jgi:hypothetical protein
MLSANADAFQPGQSWGVFELGSQEFPPLGTVVPPRKSQDHSRLLTEMNSKLADSEKNIKRLEDRNSWLEWSKKRFKERVEEGQSKIVVLEDTIQEGNGVINGMESDLKYYRARLEKADRDLRLTRCALEERNVEKVDLQEILRRTEEQVRQYHPLEVDKWIGCTLKLKFIFDEISKVGALPEDHADWILPMVESIELPSVSVRTRNQFLPSYNDAHMEDVDSDIEEERIAEWSREAAADSEQLDEDTDDGEVRLQLAIQLSIIDMACDNDTARIIQLSPEEMITDDAPNYDIDLMFNGTRVSPEEMITDDAPNYDIHFLWVSHI